ncbi:hypothetical protein VIGAN_06152000 [Vigna angularis var. angularis]|uniref:Uncharacterized protein n=1 Tax=Vigna angularis var. angularis TaxID=157739 RepID=A0A0S3SBU4_PHAAN|nr:hypothetical protein VIGAN_06152000 [Vigna angularis var. angularis]
MPIIKKNRRDGAKDGNKNLPSHFRDDDVGKRDFGRRDGQVGKQKPRIMRPYCDRNREQLNRSRGVSIQAWFQGQHFSEVIRVYFIEITDLSKCGGVLASDGDRVRDTGGGMVDVEGDNLPLGDGCRGRERSSA